MRQKLRLDRLSPLCRKILVTVVGGASLLAGIVMLITPGPAFVFIPLGLLLLSVEFCWAERMADKVLYGLSVLQRCWREHKEKRA